MNMLNEEKVSFLRQLIGYKDLRLYATSMDTIWGEKALADSFSIPSNGKWIIIEAQTGYSIDIDFEFNYLDVYQANSPKSTEYILREDGYKILSRNLSTIDFVRPYQVKTISIYKFKGAVYGLGDGTIDYDGSVIFEFSDGRKFAISTIEIPIGIAEFTSELSRINDLVVEGERRILLSSK